MTNSAPTVAGLYKARWAGNEQMSCVRVAMHDNRGELLIHERNDWHPLTDIAEWGISIDDLEAQRDAARQQLDDVTALRDMSLTMYEEALRQRDAAVARADKLATELDAITGMVDDREVLRGQRDAAVAEVARLRGECMLVLSDMAFQRDISRAPVFDRKTLAEAMVRIGKGRPLHDERAATERDIASALEARWRSNGGALGLEGKAVLALIINSDYPRALPDSGAADPRRSDFQIIEGYMPPHPGPHTRPSCVVKYTPPAGSRWTCDAFLRHSKGPQQGHFVDMYGDDYQTVALAETAIAMVLQRGSIGENDPLWRGAADPVHREPECPGPDCMMCNGSACDLCGAGCWSRVTDCEHDVEERHRKPARGGAADTARGPAPEAAVVWTEGRATVGAVTLEVDHEHSVLTQVSVYMHDGFDADDDCEVVVSCIDEDIAKRLAVAVAHEMQRGVTDGG